MSTSRVTSRSPSPWSDPLFRWKPRRPCGAARFSFCGVWVWGMGGVIACHAHGRGGEVGEMDGAGLGAWRRVRSPSWGTSPVIGLPVFWSPAVGAWCARRLRWPGSYSGDWSRKWGRSRLGGTHLRDVSRLWGTATVGGGAAGLPSADFFGRGCGRLGCRETCPLVFLGHGAGAWVACLLVTVRVLVMDAHWPPFAWFLLGRLVAQVGTYSARASPLVRCLAHLGVILRVLLLRVRAPRVDAGSVIRTLSLVPTELTVRVAECLGGPRNWGSVLYICSNRCTKMSSWNSTSR